jgi:uncharacterized membrane protein YhaH (DUF805 family)
MSRSTSFALAANASAQNKNPYFPGFLLIIIILILSVVLAGPEMWFFNKIGFSHEHLMSIMIGLNMIALFALHTYVTYKRLQEEKEKANPTP